MNWLVRLTIVLFVGTIAAARTTRTDDGPRDASPLVVTPPTQPAGLPRFETVDVYLDAGDRPIGAYQFTLHAKQENARLVGLEGGDHPAFSAAPYYDKNAILNEKVIVAAFSTEPLLPRGRTRIARLHVEVTGESAYDLAIHAAADADGNPVKANVAIEVKR